MTSLRKPVRRVTAEPFFTYGPDRDRLFVVSLAPGDLLTFRPLGRRAEVSARLLDVYRMVLVGRANATRMEKLREIKTQKETARQRRKLMSDLRKENKDL